MKNELPRENDYSNNANSALKNDFTIDKSLQKNPEEEFSMLQKKRILPVLNDEKRNISKQKYMDLYLNPNYGSRPNFQNKYNNFYNKNSSFYFSKNSFNSHVNYNTNNLNSFETKLKTNKLFSNAIQNVTLSYLKEKTLSPDSKIKK